MTIETLNRINAMLTGTSKYGIDKLCPECDGEGEIEYERTIGGIDNGGSPWQEYEPYFATCETCGGWGRIDIDPFDDDDDLS